MGTVARAPCDTGTEPPWVLLCGPHPVSGPVVAMGVMGAPLFRCWGRPGSCATSPSLLSLGPKLIHYLGEERKKNLNICS